MHTLYTYRLDQSQSLFQTRPQTTNSNFKTKIVPQTLPRFVKLKVCRTSANHFGKPPNPWRWRWGAACSMPRVSDIDDAYDISARYILLSNCVVQVMRVWSLPAFLSPLAKQHIRYGVTQRTAYRISNGVCGGRGIRYHARISGCLSSCAGRS